MFHFEERSPRALPCFLQPRLIECTSGWIRPGLRLKGLKAFDRKVLTDLPTHPQTLSFLCLMVWSGQCVWIEYFICAKCNIYLWEQQSLDFELMLCLVCILMPRSFRLTPAHFLFAHPKLSIHYTPYSVMHMTQHMWTTLKGIAINFVVSDPEEILLHLIGRDILLHLCLKTMSPGSAWITALKWEQDQTNL